MMILSEESWPGMIHPMGRLPCTGLMGRARLNEFARSFVDEALM